MRTASTVRPLVVALAVLATGSTGCARAPAIVNDELLQPLGVRTPWLPNAADLAAAKMARLSLVAEPRGGEVDPEVEQALEALEDDNLSEAQSNLVPLAIDLRNATLDDPIAYRTGARALRRRPGLDPRLEGRLDRTIADDPLKLAGRRQFDGWHRLWARTFNAVAEPIGSSAITGFVIAPFQLANSLIHYFADFSNREPLSLTDRQALVLRQQFLARHPNTSATPTLERKIERGEKKLDATLADRRLRASASALKAHDPALALYQSQRAHEILDRHPTANARRRARAEQAVERATQSLDERNARHASSIEARITPAPLAATERELSTQLFAGAAGPAALAHPLDDYRRAGAAANLEPYVEGRIEFLRSLAQFEAGFEAASRRSLERSAKRDTKGDTMTRHARALLDSDWQNPFGAFERLRRKAGRDELAWRLAGEWVRRPRYPNLPVPIAYLIDTPTIAMTIILAPLRALISPWTGGTPDFRRGAALAGYRYLIRFPDGEEQRPVIRWLYRYETDRERWTRALRLADWIPEFPAQKRAELVEKTANARVDRVDRLERRDERGSLLRGVAREFPDSAGGHRAGLQARSEREDASPQLIRITRGFLLENPLVAGREGIGLNPTLLDDDPTNGELHPEGIVLRGGRIVEVLLIADGASHKDPPTRRVIEISPQRLQQLVATLDEAVQRNSLIDTEARQTADANRDRYLERAGLGLTEDVDLRASAESFFVYESLRERYGMVRGRDSVLPFDLVFRGSLGDFTLGAFPRWRMPRETPDAFLYR
jgi:hypothetical protein